MSDILYYDQECEICESLVQFFQDKNPVNKPIIKEVSNSEHNQKECLASTGMQQYPCLVSEDGVLWDVQEIIEKFEAYHEDVAVFQLYMHAECPFCQKVVTHIKELHLEQSILCCDIQDSQNEKALIDLTNSKRIPCLKKLDNSFMYESDAIISYITSMVRPIEDRIREAIMESIPDSEVHVYDPNCDQTHFEAVVISDTFKHLSLVKQHQMVMKAVADLMKDTVHDVALKTFTVQGWADKRNG